MLVMDVVLLPMFSEEHVATRNKKVYIGLRNRSWSGEDETAAPKKIKRDEVGGFVQALMGPGDQEKGDK